MASNNYLIELSAGKLATVQSSINSLLLDGLDVRLTPVGPARALLPVHLVTAIKAQYGKIDVWNYLQRNGVKFSSHALIGDKEALALVEAVPENKLDVGPVPVIAPVIAPAATAAGPLQWHLDKINVAGAWALLGGPDNIAWKCKVGQIDTGFTRHPALGFAGGASPSSWLDEAACRNYFSPSHPGEDPGDASGEDPRSGTFWGHGTRIGATISGWHDKGDAGATHYGAAPRVPHVVVRISNSVGINDQLPAFTRALNYLVNEARVDVVNLSMGVFPPYLSKEARRAVDNAYEKGVILVCAGGQHVGQVIAPASYARSIAVSATNAKDQVWAKASRGPAMDWAAPGVDIRRATLAGKKGPYVYEGGGNGTSFASALSTGVAALWLTHRHGELAAYPQKWMRVAAFRELGRRTTTKIPIWGPNVAGTGVLNAQALLNEPLPAAAALVKEPALA